MVFDANILNARLWIKKQVYVQVINLFSILKNEKKDYQETEVSEFRIKLDTTIFTTRLSRDKLVIAIVKICATLSNSLNSLSYFDIQSLIGFLSFCSKIINIGKIL